MLTQLGHKVDTKWTSLTDTAPLGLAATGLGGWCGNWSRNSWDTGNWDTALWTLGYRGHWNTGNWDTVDTGIVWTLEHW